MLARAAFPASIAFSEPLPRSTHSATHCSLHRPAASANGGAWCDKMAQTSPMVVGSETTAEDAAGGGAGAAQDPIDEGRGTARPPRLLGGMRPPPRTQGRQEAQGWRRTGLPAPTGGPDGRRTAGWAEGDAEDVAPDGALCAPEPTFVRARTCSSVYSNPVYGAS